ncbi:MAG: 30S ribosomal protein S26e [Candidatus Bathyarchaeota archaeon]|nr:MAG: 30S ribosomal protein S26e [Candidatus Bathyarchaeota archaeon]
MPKKRRSGGRSKGGKGRSASVQCCQCGQVIPRDKAKKVTRYSSLVDRSLTRELRAKGAIIARPQVEKYYCISCAVHRGIVKPRSKSKRHRRQRL